MGRGGPSGHLSCGTGRHVDTMVVDYPLPPSFCAGGSALKAPRITLDLLDESLRVPVHTWKFENRDLIRIGRADENDVVIRQMTVSRVHAELHWRDGQWILINHSQNGTLVAGMRVEEIALCAESVFQ